MCALFSGTVNVEMSTDGSRSLGADATEERRERAGDDTDVCCAAEAGVERAGSWSLKTGLVGKAVEELRCWKRLPLQADMDFGPAMFERRSVYDCGSEVLCRDNVGKTFESLPTIP